MSSKDCQKFYDTRKCNYDWANKGVQKVYALIPLDYEQGGGHWLLGELDLEKRECRVYDSAEEGQEKQWKGLWGHFLMFAFLNFFYSEFCAINFFNEYYFYI